jgi:hypothetical protein
MEYVWIILAAIGGFGLGWASAWGAAGIEASKFIKDEGDRMQREFDAERDKRIAVLVGAMDSVVSGQEIPKDWNREPLPFWKNGTEDA